MTLKYALITGANRGIGLQVAKDLAAHGYFILLGIRKASEGKRLEKEFAENGFDVAWIELDMSDLKSIDTATQRIADEYGQLDVLVNNAGIMPGSHMESALDVEAATLHKLQTTVMTNTFGPFLLSQRVIPLMQKHGYGRIVNVSSGLGQLHDMTGNGIHYRISKTAINVVTRVLATETSQDNIKINSVCPGWVRTDMGGSRAPRDVKQGAATMVWAAMLPDDGPTGKFFRDKKEIDW